MKNVRTGQKLLIIPGASSSLGGTLITLSLLLQGLEKIGVSNRVQVLVKEGSLSEKYLENAGHGKFLHPISAANQGDFLKKSLRWVKSIDSPYSLLLDNCVTQKQILVLIRQALFLRFSQHKVFHFFHDLAFSYNPAGFIARKLAFTLLSPIVICNSNYTAKYISKISKKAESIMYQPVDFNDYTNDYAYLSPPPELKPILQNGQKILLVPSRINKPNQVNDKNLSTLIPVLQCLKRKGHAFHLVLIGQDRSPEKVLSKELLDLADTLGVSDRFTILPPSFEIQAFYRYSHMMVSLAPREPFGRTIVEAIASGIPVVGSNTGGINEILSHFAPAWTVDPYNPEAVAEKIIEVSNSPETMRLLERGKEWVFKECNYENYAFQMASLTGLI